MPSWMVSSVLAKYSIFMSFALIQATRPDPGVEIEPSASASFTQDHVAQQLPSLQSHTMQSAVCVIVARLHLEDTEYTRNVTLVSRERLAT